jgi:cardiolipin synthase
MSVEESSSAYARRPEGPPFRLLTTGITASVTAAATLFSRNFFGSEKKIKRRIAQRYGISDPQFERAMSQLLGPRIVDGNFVTLLRNGVEIFPAMLAAIERAERSITFETFVHWTSDIAQNFADALATKARRGIKVHMLLDGCGCDGLTGAGVELEISPPKFGRVNHRTHRKLLVIDGKIGFTGGVGIADQWTGNAGRRKNGAIRTIASKGRWWRRCRRLSSNGSI